MCRKMINTKKKINQETINDNKTNLVSFFLELLGLVKVQQEISFWEARKDLKRRVMQNQKQEKLQVKH